MAGRSDYPPKESQDSNSDLKRMAQEWDSGGYPPTETAPTMFRGENTDNLVKWQLDIKEELARIEHLLRKHVPKVDKKTGEMYYAEPEDGEQLFNETGVNEILNILSWYLNKNIILSNFSESEIKQRCKQFSDYLTNFIFNNYQRFGLNTKEKIKHFPMIVMNLVNTVEAAYNRALNGGERESLRTARQVTQQEPIYNQQLPQMQGQGRRSGSMLNPMNWGRG